MLSEQQALPNHPFQNETVAGASACGLSNLSGSCSEASVHECIPNPILQFHQCGQMQGSSSLKIDRYLINLAPLLFVFFSNKAGLAVWQQMLLIFLKRVGAYDRNFLNDLMLLQGRSVNGSFSLMNYMARVDAV